MNLPFRYIIVGTNEKSKNRNMFVENIIMCTYIYMFVRACP